MKFNSCLLAALAVTGLAQVASAQTTTVIDITGATAFRGAAVTAIKASFSSTPVYGFTGTSFTGAQSHIFKGSFPGIADTTVIRTFWSGSTEGARSCVFDINNPYLPESTAGLTTAGVGSLATASLVNANTHDLFFSDTTFSNTIYSRMTLNPADTNELPVIQTAVGAIVFCPIKNEMATTNSRIASYNRFTNIQENQFRSLFSPGNLGRMLLSQLTGEADDSDLVVFATGRNDLSGTRTSYLIESGYGASTSVNQWKMFSTTTNVMTTIQFWPTGDVPNATTDNRSVQWTQSDATLVTAGYTQGGSEVAGNGGYFSSSALRDQMDDLSASVDVLLDDGSDLYGAKQNVILVSYVANADAATAIGAGARALTWNGVGYTPASPISAADKEKISGGQYTAWNFEQFIKTGAASAAETTVYNAIIPNISASIGSAGLTMVEMGGTAPVIGDPNGDIRAADGGDITITVP